jgi:hypothetical protein
MTEENTYSEGWLIKKEFINLSYQKDGSYQREQSDLDPIKKFWSCK